MRQVAVSGLMRIDLSLECLLTESRPLKQSDSCLAGMHLSVKMRSSLAALKWFRCRLFFRDGFLDLSRLAFCRSSMLDSESSSSLSMMGSSSVLFKWCDLWRIESCL